jgi:septal ring factor EnvC (AmiA/AmiB activator)
MLTSGIRLPILALVVPLYFTHATKMVGVSDPSLAAALTTQSKQLEAQSKNISNQSKLLQQLCDRLETQDVRWRTLEQSVVANSDEIAAIQTQIANRDSAPPNTKGALGWLPSKSSWQMP